MCKPSCSDWESSLGRIRGEGAASGEGNDSTGSLFGALPLWHHALDFSHERGHLGLRVGAAGPANCDPFDQVNPPLARLYSTDEALLPPDRISQLPLGQLGARAQVDPA